MPRRSRLEDSSIPGVFAVGGLSLARFDPDLAGQAAGPRRCGGRRMDPGPGRKRPRDGAPRQRRGPADGLPDHRQRLALDTEDRPRDAGGVGASPRWIEARQLVGSRQVFGRSLYELFPGTHEKWRPVYDRCLAGESVSADRVEFPRPDGSVIWLQVELSPWHGSSRRDRRADPSPRTTSPPWWRPWSAPSARKSACAWRWKPPTCTSGSSTIAAGN